MSRIIVGVDRSAAASAAVHWAVEHARPDDVIAVTHAWELLGVGSLEAPSFNPADFEVQAYRLVNDLIRHEVGVESEGVPTLEAKVVHGHAAEVLIEESKNADLLVVGSRGTGGFKGMLLGSVSNQVVQHAHCPVVVIPATPADR